MQPDTVIGVGEDQTASLMYRMFSPTADDVEWDELPGGARLHWRAIVINLRDILLPQPHTQAFAQGAEAMREAAIALASEHLSRVPHHVPGEQAGDLVGQGYCNASSNIKIALQRLPLPPAGKPGGEC